MSDDKAPSFEEMKRRIKQAGYRLQNLCHRYDGMWQCNLRRADKTAVFQFAYGVTEGHAMERALDKALGGKSVQTDVVHPDDADPLQVGQSKDPTAPIPPGEMGGKSGPAAAEEDLIG